MIDFFEQIREWVNKSARGKIIAAFISFYTGNLIVWGIVEPLSVWLKLPNYYLFIHYGISILITVGVMMYVLHRKLVLLINYQSASKDFGQVWNTVEGHPVLKISTDPSLGKYVSFAGKKSDASRLSLEGAGSTGTAFKFIYNPKTESTFYIYLIMTTSDGTQSKVGCIAFRDDINAPVKHGESEWHFPLKYYNVENKWLSSSINIKQVFNKTFATDRWKFKKLSGFQIRGTIDLQTIVLYRDTLKI